MAPRNSAHSREGRNWVIILLEFFDSIGVTKRNGNFRTVRPDYQRIVGVAAPYNPDA